MFDNPQMARLYRVLEVFRQIDPEMPAQTVATFILIAGKPGITVREVQDALGIASSSASRNVAALRKYPRRDGSPGPHLIDTEEDARDRRIKHLILTAAGRRLYQTIVSLMGG
jgi:DNA-binding MarR family transcriptional regulator